MHSVNFILIMGVSGCGKTTVGKRLAKRLGWDFYDADDFHPPVNIEKMSQGMPLNDTDRALWLETLHALISSCSQANQPGVLACSALKEQYRLTLLDGNPGVQIVYLKGSYDLIWSRLSSRTKHYMKPNMLKSQLIALEEPKNALVINIEDSVEQIVDIICEEIFP